MKSKHSCRRCTALLLAFLLLLTLLTGCRSQIVEKTGVLPDRPTQFVAHNTENEEETPEGKSWNVQNVDKLQLFSSEMTISTLPSTHYFDNTAYLYRTVSQETGDTLYSLEQIEADGTLSQLHTMIAANESYCQYSPDGTIAAYETWIDGCLTLILIDLATNEERILWQSDEASVLKDLGISARLALQWSPDGSTLLFLPICFDDGSIQITPSTSSDDSLQSSGSAQTDEMIQTNEETIDLQLLTAAEKMQIVYESLPDFPIIYAYQLPQKNLHSFLIASEDYPLYDSETLPMICANHDGSRFFIYFNSPWDPDLSHYIDLLGILHYSTPLSDYLPAFTKLGSAPLFYEDLLYLHVDGVGIMVLDPQQGSLYEMYPFNDPIHSFTIYDNTLIVAQPSGIGGVDVTAYLLNLDTKQSVLLYHNNETSSPFINHMEMSQDGMHLLIEQLPSEYHTQKQLIQLSFR